MSAPQTTAGATKMRLASTQLAATSVTVNSATTGMDVVITAMVRNGLSGYIVIHETGKLRVKIIMIPYKTLLEHAPWDPGV